MILKQCSHPSASSTGFQPVGQAGILPAREFATTGETPVGPTARMAVLHFQDHALDVRINIERRRPQKADQRLIAFPRKFGSECRRR